MQMKMDATSPRNRRTTVDPTKCRGSCDACTKSKVRCSKEKPSCQRCIKQAAICHYSPALRYHKPSSLSTPTEPQPRTPGHHHPSPTTSTSDLSSSLTSERDREQSPVETSTAIKNFSPQPVASQDVSFSIVQTLPEYGDEISTAWNMGLLVDDDPTGQFEIGSSNQSTLNDWVDQPSFPSTYNQMFDYENDLQFYLNIMTPDTTAVPPSYSCLTTSTGNIAHHNQVCTTLAFSTLHSLQASFTSCSLVPPSSNFALAPSVDWVLKNNKTAVIHVLDILDCPCSVGQHFALLITLMSSKILAWYSAVLQNDCKPCSSASAPSPSSPEQVTHLPITIGAYQLSGEDHSKMIAQLVLAELQTIGWTVDKFNKRYCKEGKMHLMITLESFLRASLKATTDLAIDRLKGT